MFRSFLILIFVCFTAPALSSSFEMRDYGDNQCDMGPYKSEPFDLDLTAGISGNDFGSYNVNYSKYEQNLIDARRSLRQASGQCLKDPSGKQACQKIIESVKHWQKQGYIISKSPFDSDNWWEESFQSNEFFVYMVEALSVAEQQLNSGIAKDKEVINWLHEALHKNRKYKTSKNNHRTVWVIAAAKVAQLTGTEIKMGFEKKSAAELIEWELKFQFSKMEKNGALPYEAIRGRRAVFYTGRQLGYLSALLEMGEKINLRSYAKYETKLHQAVAFMLDAIDDVEVIYPYAKKMKSSPKGDPRNQDYGRNGGEKWGTFSFMKVYASRFGDHSNVKRMKGHPVVGRYLSGDNKVTKGFGIDTGCLNPSVKSTLAKVNFAARSKSNLEKQAACFISSMEAKGFQHPLTEDEIETLINNVVSSNASKVSKLALRRFGLSTKTINENGEALLELLNFPGSAEEYCGQLNLDSKATGQSKIAKNCKFQITRKSGTNTQKLVLNRGELGIDANGSLIFGENDGYKLKTKKGQMKDLLQNSSNLRFVDNRLSGDFSTYHGKDSAEPELVTISHLKPNADKFDGKYPFVYSSGADGELTIYICKDPE